jgi:hypothetical protein
MPGKDHMNEPDRKDYDGTFQSNTPVCGEAFEQLHLIHMHTVTDSFGFLSTFNDWAVTSTIKEPTSVDEDDFKNILEHFSRDKAKSGTKGPVTPDRQSNAWVRHALTTVDQPDEAVRTSTKKGKQCQNVSPTKWRSKIKKGKLGTYRKALGG